MGLDSILKGDRKSIFELFVKETKLKFSDIEKSLKEKSKIDNKESIRSNMIAYHLDALKTENVIEKSGEYWKLTKEYERLLPIFSNLSDMNLGPVCVVLVIATNKKTEKKDINKILLIKRDKKPYKDYWSIFGKKMIIGESISNAAIRCIKEETGLDAKFNKMCAVLHERLKEDNEFKHAFLFVLTKVDVKEECQNSSVLKWFDIKKLSKGKIIPSDIYMINNFLNKRAVIKEIVMEEKDNKLNMN